MQRMASSSYVQGVAGADILLSTLCDAIRVDKKLDPKIKQEKVSPHSCGPISSVSVHLQWYNIEAPTQSGIYFICICAS